MKTCLDDVLGRARVLVCVGQGGVGKTSSSAAIALEAAHRGRRSLVLTIDPARRLANALGIPEIGNEERAIEKSAFERLGLRSPPGHMTAMMLDIKRAWDDVISKHHPDPERRARLLNNRLYEKLSTALAGSQEYMAMETLYTLSTRQSDPLDLIVLDTPPASNAVDFLEAPSRMIDALDNDATRWLLEPYLAQGRVSSRLFDAGSSFFIRTIAKFTGAELIDDLAELLAGFQGMFEGFRERARAVQALLSREDTLFVVVSAPRGNSMVEARAFRDRLVERGVHVGGMVLNRATVDPFQGLPDSSQALLAAAGPAGRVLAERLIHTAEAMKKNALEERARAERLRADLDIPVAVAEELPRDVHDLLGLEALRGFLFLTSRGSGQAPLDRSGL